jgi:hypothetical protein
MMKVGDKVEFVHSARIWSPMMGVVYYSPRLECLIIISAGRAFLPEMSTVLRTMTDEDVLHAALKGDPRVEELTFINTEVVRDLLAER